MMAITANGTITRSNGRPATEYVFKCDGVVCHRAWGVNGLNGLVEGLEMFMVSATHLEVESAIKHTGQWPPATPQSWEE